MSDVRCEECWREAQRTAHDYESVTDAYYAAMKRAEDANAPCTKRENRSCPAAEER